MAKDFSQQDFDALIIGGGPAGMAAAIWCADLGLTACLLEKCERLGGQLHDIHNPITNYPGVASTTGDQLAGAMTEQVRRTKVDVRTEAEIAYLDTSSRRLTLADGANLTARSLILATGVRRRKLNVPGEEKFRGKGILTSGALERSKVAGRRVLIIGGGDAALENAVILSETAESVTVAHRGSRFSARKEFLQEAAKRKNVEFVFECTVNDFIGQDHLTGATLERGGTERSLRAIETDFALIRIGVEPNTDIPGLLPTGASDYMTVDANGQTRFPFVFASGDVANQHSPTIATAIGTGATAAKILFRHLRADGKAA